MTGGAISVRLATVADAARLPGIERSAARAFLATAHAAVADEPPSAPDAWIPAIAAGRLWVAESAGAPAGFVATGPLADALHIHELAVCADRQRRGIGTALMEAARAAATAAGLRALTLTTFADVPFNAPWYARLGFAVVTAPPPHLAAILDREAARGLTRRCAMRAAL